jgi:L-asparaginase
MAGSKPKIHLIYTGGTIGMVKDPATGNLQPFDFEGLLAHIPELKALGVDITTEGFDHPVDSSNMHAGHWQDLVRRIERRYAAVDGFVILHGSDTMAFTASALSFMVEHPGKPIILTGAQLPIGILRSDARENLITALELAAARGSDGKPMLQEVAVYFEYKLYRGNRVVKWSAEDFQAFQSYNYPHLAEVGVSIKWNAEALLRTTSEPTVFHRALEGRIAVLHLFPGMDFQVFQPPLQDLKALILLTFGAGNAPENPRLHQLIDACTQAGIPVVNVTQCRAGGVHQGMYQTSEHLRSRGVIGAGDMTLEAAVTKLMVLLGQEKSGPHLEAAFADQCVGERSY